MSRHSFGISVVGALALGCLAAGPAGAQTNRARGPFAGLFGGGQKPDQSLDFRGSLFGAYDFDTSGNGNAPPVASDFGDFGAQSGLVRAFEGELQYRRSTELTHFSVSGTGAFQQYPASAFNGATYGANSTLDTHVTRRVKLTATGDLTHTPFYSFAGFLGTDVGNPIPLTPGYDSAAVGAPTTTLDGRLALTGELTNRSNLEAGVYLDRTAISKVPSAGLAEENFSAWGADLIYHHQITKALTFHTGYGREVFRGSDLTTPPVIQTIDAGLDFSHALSVSRRTTVSLDASTVAVRFGGEMNYDVDGHATLTHEMGRTWTANLAYARGTTFIPAFGEPVLYDRFETSVSGQITPRTEFAATAGYSHDQLGFVGPNGFRVYEATSLLEIALTRDVAMFGQYAYYRYRIPTDLTTLPVPGLFARHAVTVGLSVWLPLIHARSSQ